MQNNVPKKSPMKNWLAPIRVLGIDPGYERLGIAVIERAPDAHGKITDTLLFSECFRTPPKLPFHERLAMLGKECALVIEEYAPTVLGIETLFFTNNQKTAMHVSEARGVILYEAAKNGLDVCEFTPPEIKVATTSHGGSDKKQIIAMIPRLIKITKKITHDDEFDAIAVAITCLAHRR